MCVERQHCGLRPQHLDQWATDGYGPLPFAIGRSARDKLPSDTPSFKSNRLNRPSVSCGDRQPVRNGREGYAGGMNGLRELVLHGLRDQ